ncbi:SpoIIIAH-like family protein [Paenibacillus sp. SYP-B3998]|uniref:SpoIIIAH-like family protein n=1 Tax=Paenibacillus sp. SYP-B3998 TaxID=2678564 RepID=A0A6G3ZVS6_9BACL|nr:SpoIIIAH-like family protein [Paenibacillus sp. SYP-B3998]NEW06215.1 SpoIIIAH-like family protein [Paenibacillus sp. SYP-B3998]
MNAKRQTIWLVSMLSLMVVLSAYYLFTEDVNKLDLASTETATKPQEVKIDMSQVDPATGKTDVKATTGVDAKSGTKTDPKSDPKTGTQATTTTKTDVKTEVKTDVKADASKTTTVDPTKTTKSTTTAKTDDQIIKQVEEQAKTTSAGDYFTNEQMKQHELFSKKSSDLMGIIVDSKQTPEAVVKANNDLEKLADVQDKVEGLQDRLLKDFPQAIVNQDGNKWKITVQSDKLEKSQGVTIVDMVVKELGAAPENIKVQYVRP